MNEELHQVGTDRPLVLSETKKERKYVYLFIVLKFLNGLLSHFILMLAICILITHSDIRHRSYISSLKYRYKYNF